MSGRTLLRIFCFIGGFFLISTCVTGRTLVKDFNQSLSSAAGYYSYGIVAHRIGRMVLAIANNGTFGTSTSGADVDFFSGEAIPACEYPKGSNTRYLYDGAFWIGAVKDSDTLVSVGTSGWGWSSSEFTAEPAGLTDIVKRTSLISEPTYSPDAVSEEDYIMVYTDTVTEGLTFDFDDRFHRPLEIKVTQRSFAWSYEYSEDFVLFDYTVQNIGSNRLEDAYMGIYVDGDVYWGQDGSNPGHNDDICGFVEALPTQYGNCTFRDTVNIAWIADNDGDPGVSSFEDWSVKDVTGTRIVRTPADSLEVSFNWWVSSGVPSLDFGPRERPGAGVWPEEFRDFGTGGLGTPVGDANKYYQMRNREFDYDQILTGTIPYTDSLWLPPTQELARDCADGYDTRYLLSFGPFNIDPGERLPLSFAYVAGENFHTDPHNGYNLPSNPDLFYNNINFSDLCLNAAWAGRVYDNPGVDTDGDGYAGKVRICCQDSSSTSLNNIADTCTVDFYDPGTCEIVWYEGDGVPDFAGACPPPRPHFWIEPAVGFLRVRINGQSTETSKDVFSRVNDFEGYRVYLGLDERESSFSLIGSYDKEDFKKHVWTGFGFEVLDTPYSLDSLRCLYGARCNDSLFDPLRYTSSNPYFHPYFADSVFYFTAQDFNCNEYSGNSLIRKTYPGQPYPSSLNPDSANPEELTEDGYLKYFEYELTIDQLLPTVAYWVNVTAFDFGSPELHLQPLENSVALGAKVAYANTTSRDAVEQGLAVYVYPNPYRIDAGYRDMGFEGRSDSDRPDHRVRAINFANLPPKCTISIFSLDGDLIRQLRHESSIDDAAASHESWNLITRNTQMVVSGLYYWVVEADDGETQVGKFTIIM